MKARLRGLSGVFPSARHRSVLKCRVLLSAHLTEQHLTALRHELSIQRDLRGMTYDDLALASGVSRRTLVAIEVGKSRGSVESWLHICEALGTTFAQFMEDSVTAHVDSAVPHTDAPPETITLRR
jgi:putative transcriptional regulator